MGEFDDLLNQVGQGTPESSAQAYDQLLDETVGRQEDFSGLLAEAGGQRPRPGWAGLGTSFFEGLQRNMRQLQAVPAGVRSLYNQAAGDPVEAMLAAEEVREIEARAPQGQWRLQDVHSTDEFAHWFAERFGENALTLLSTVAFGGAGGLAGHLGARALGGSVATRALATRAGALTGAFGSSAATEATGTSGELYEATGQVRPGLALPAGVAKGLLELVFPTLVGKALVTPGRQLGSTIPRAIGWSAAVEGGTEVMQESIDIAARMYADPNYQFFNEGAWRLAEAGLAGGLIGGVVGAGPAYLERRQAQTGPDESGLAPGERVPLEPGAEMPPTPEAPPMLETVASPAVEVEGKLYTAATHIQAVEQAAAELNLTPEQVIEKYSNEEGDDPLGRFITSTGRVISRKEATALADQRGQIDKESEFHREYTRVFPENADNALHSSTLRPPPKPVGMLRPRPEGQVEVYRGDTVGFDIPQVWKAAAGEPGLFFTDRLSEAEQYAKGADQQYSTGSNISRTTLDTRNLKPYTPPKPQPGVDQSHRLQRDLARIREEGFDGVIAEVDGRKQYIVWNQQAILSPTDKPSDNLIHLAGVRIQQPRKTPEGFSPAAPANQSDPEAVGMAPREPTVPAETGDAGPVSVLRRLSQQGPTGNLNLKEVTTLSPQLDPLDVRPLIRAAGLDDNALDSYMEWFEANTPRYAMQYPEGGFNNTLLTDVDLELEQLRYPQAVEPAIWQIDQNALMPVLITAELMDLPASNSRRVWFLPGTKLAEQEQLLQKYEALRTQVEQRRPAYLSGAEGMYNITKEFWTAYGELLVGGLRVVPSRGSSFYYGAGPLKGVRTKVTSTSRGTHNAFLTPDGVLHSVGFVDNQLFTEQGYVLMRDALPVTINYNKVTPGSITALPQRQEDTKTLFRYHYENVSADLQDRVHWEVANVTPFIVWTEANLEALRKVLKKYNTYIDPRKYKVDNVVSIERLKLNQLTPGVAKARIVETDEHPNTKLRLDFIKSTQPQTGKLRVAPDVQHIPHVKRMAQELRKLIPLMNKIARDLGLENVPNVELVRDDTKLNSVAQFDLITNTITFFVSPRWDSFMNLTDAGMRQEIFTTLFHEFGHKLTMHYYAQTPVELQQQILYAYNKALLAARQVPQGVRFRLTWDPMQQLDNTYYMQFLEWLAEQFRRYTYSDQTVRSELELKYQQLAQQLERYYKKLEEAAHPQFAKDFTQPDYYFSAWMQYLRDYGKTKVELKQMARQQKLYAIDTEIYNNPQSTMVMNKVQQVLESMKPMFPEQHPFHLLFSQELDQKLAPIEDGGVLARTVFGNRTTGRKKAYMELAIGSLHRADEAQIGEVFAHELIHVYRYLGLISREEMNTLYTAAIKEGKHLSPEAKQALSYQVFKDKERYGWSDLEAAEHYQDAIREETVAYYVGEFARTGIARPEAKPLLERILQLLKDIAREMLGLGYVDRDQILQAFFRGEMVNRDRRKVQDAERTQMSIRALADPLNFKPDEIKQYDDRYEVRIARSDPADADFENWAIYQYVDKQTGKVVGQQELVITERGFNVEMHYSDAPGMAFRWLQWVEKDLGVPLLAPPTFTESGIRAAARMFPLVRKYYIKTNIKGETEYVSPRYIKQQLEKWKKIVLGMERARSEYGFVVDVAQYNSAKAKLRLAQLLYNKIPKDLWDENKHLLNQMFMMPRNYHRDGVQGSLVRNGLEADEAQLADVALGPVEPSRLTDHATSITNEAMRNSRRTAAQQLGIDYGEVAASDPVSRNIRRLISWADRTGSRTDPRYERNLARVHPAVLVSQEADKISHFSKLYFGLRQLIWRNEHLTNLQQYGQQVERYSAAITAWHQEADDVARVWEQRLRSTERRSAFNAFMYWLAEMQYLSPAERAADVVRHPSRAELMTELRRRSLDTQPIIGADGLLWRLYQPPWQPQARPSIFARFLNEVERISIANITATTADPLLRARAIAAVQAELNELRQKPYYPVSRFGQHTITVRDPGNNNEVVYFRVFQSHTERDRALPEVRRLYPTENLYAGRMPEEYLEFLGLPGPLIRNIRENLPNIDATQIAWLEDLERQNLPDKAFRARWTPRTGTPGYDMDAFRSFAHYFMHGSRYLARMEFRTPMMQEINGLRNTIQGLPNSSKRRMIVDFMVRHYNYLMQGGRDWAKTKAAVAALQLGFSPAAAFMNLTQTPMVSLPWLGGVFGSSRGQLLKSIKAVRGLRQGSVTSAVAPGYEAARQEMIRQGRIDIGQSAELGAYAEGINLNGFFSGSTRQKMFRNWVWYSMWMFQKAEQANREVLMHAVWELGHKRYNETQRLREVENAYHMEIADLQLRTGMPYRDAVVFILAKEALDQTQGLYAPYARPTFMRHPVAGTFLIFYQFMQMMSYAFFFNPGAVRMWLMMAMAYGVAGLPGADDITEVIRALSVSLFGKDFDIKKEVRRMVRDITRGTIFDEVGPDIFLHGISRYAFGLGLLPDSYGAPRFDASANGSMGKTIPGLYEYAHGVATAAPFDRVATDTMQRMAGAGFGWIFNLTQFGMQSPGTVDGHRWEQALPRVIRGMATGLRYLPPEYNPGQVQTYLGLSPSVGAATSASGARIVNFNAADPDHLAEAVGQMLGFRPTRVSEATEARMAITEFRQIAMARRSALFVQLASARLGGVESVTERVMQAIQRYNEEMVRAGSPELSITNDHIRRSMQSRERSRLLQEEFVPDQKMLRPGAERLLDLFPGVKAQRVR